MPGCVVGQLYLKIGRIQSDRWILALSLRLTEALTQQKHTIGDAKQRYISTLFSAENGGTAEAPATESSQDFNFLGTEARFWPNPIRLLDFAYHTIITL